MKAFEQRLSCALSLTSSIGQILSYVSNGPHVLKLLLFYFQIVCELERVRNPAVFKLSLLNPGITIHTVNNANLTLCIRVTAYHVLGRLTSSDTLSKTFDYQPSSLELQIV